MLQLKKNNVAFCRTHQTKNLKICMTAGSKKEKLEFLFNNNGQPLPKQRLTK